MYTDWLMPTLFVVMPFGPGRVPHIPALDFDAVYHELIRPAGKSAGWQVRRIDELAEPGPITDQYLREIYSADLLLADISIPNGNVYYELGIRHGIASGGTILIAVNGTAIPFDISTHRVFFYDPDPAQWPKAREVITAALTEHGKSTSDNPVRTFLEHIAATASPLKDMAAFERDLRARIDRARTLEQLIAVWMWARHLSPIPAAPLLTLADHFSEYDEWVLAAEALRSALNYAPGDFEIYRQLGWCLQFAGPEFDSESATAFQEALRLNPNDPETLGMMGGRAKRLSRYDEAAAYYAEGVRIAPNSLYMRVNEAAMKILSDPVQPEAGVELYRRLVKQTESSFGAAADEWTELVIAESLFAIGDPRSASHYTAAKSIATTSKSLASAARQLQLFASVGFRPQEAFQLAAILEDVPRLQPVVTMSPAATPAGALSEHPQPALPVLIHLSDLHFGVITKDGKSVSMHRFYDGENSQPLVKHLEDEFVATGSHFSFTPEQMHLIVSGDLVYTGSEKEYEEAFQFFVDATAALRIDRRNVHVIPGNHDISWNLAKQHARYRFDPYLKFLAEFYGADVFQQKYPLVSWPLSLTNRPAAHDLLAVSHHPESNLLIAGLNSCVYESEQHHYGFVGERQLRNVRRVMSSLDVSPETVRVALIHHHLHPFPETLQDREGGSIWVDVSTIRDAGLVERSLERLAFDIVLHGHKHKPQLRETLVQESDPSKGTLRRLIVAGAGTASCVELEPSVPNHYEVIELRGPRVSGSEFVRLEWRVLHVEGGAEWTTLKTWTILG